MVFVPVISLAGCSSSFVCVRSVSFVVSDCVDVCAHETVVKRSPSTTTLPPTNISLADAVPVISYCIDSVPVFAFMYFTYVCILESSPADCQYTAVSLIVSPPLAKSKFSVTSPESFIETALALPSF